MLVKCLQICAHVFIDRPQNCAQTSFPSRAGLCLNFGRSRARLCPISFAPWPFPNLAGTLRYIIYIDYIILWGVSLVIRHGIFAIEVLVVIK